MRSSNETIPSQRTVCSGASADSRRCKSRRNTETTLLYQSPDSRKSSASGSASCRAVLKSFDFPGIHISHIQTVDFEDEETEELEQVEEPSDPMPPKYASGFRRNVILSDAYSDTSRVSFPSSEYSGFAGSRSRGSRPSSRESSVLSPRLWDFSPRGSDSDLGTPIDVVFREDFVYRSGGSRDNGSWTPSERRVPTGVLDGEACRGFRESAGGHFVHHSRMPRKGSLVTVNYVRTSSRASSVKSSVRSSP